MTDQAERLAFIRQAAAEDGYVAAAFALDVITPLLEALDGVEDALAAARPALLDAA